MSRCPTVHRGSRRTSLLAIMLGSLLTVASLGAATAADAATVDEIVFVRYVPGSPVYEDIYTTGFSGAGATQLTHSPAISDVTPAWSPGGRRIVFRSNGALAIMKADGTGFFSLPGTADAVAPAWSPDGTSIAYAQGFQNNSEIYVYSLTNGGSIQLTNNGKEDKDPAWSPDGSRIVFSRHDPSASGYEYDLWVMRADGSQETPLTNTPGWETRPDWSPDGRSIVYSHGQVGATTHLWMIPVAGGTAQQLTHGAYSDMPAWSPGGSHIAFMRGKDDESAPSHIWIIEVRSGTERQVTNGQFKDYSPDWR